MDEGIKVLVTDVLDIIDNIAEQYYRRYSIEEMADEQTYNTALTVLQIMINRLEDLAEESDETNTDYTE